MIRVVALVHQYQREVKTATDLDGQPFHYIEATGEDVALADRLMHALLEDTLEELTPQARKLLATLRRLALKGSEHWDRLWWTRRQLRESTRWSDRQIRQALKQLVEFEFMQVRGGGMGRRAFYRLADPPEASLVTTSPLVTSPQPRHHDRQGLTDGTCACASTSSSTSLTPGIPDLVTFSEDERRARVSTKP